jgi:hypothetical protein
MPGQARQAYKNIPQNDISEVADMPLFVRIYGCVLDQDVLRVDRLGPAEDWSRALDLTERELNKCIEVEVEVEEAGACRLDPGKKSVV